MINMHPKIRKYHDEYAGKPFIFPKHGKTTKAQVQTTTGNFYRNRFNHIFFEYIVCNQLFESHIVQASFIEENIQFLPFYHDSTLKGKLYECISNANKQKLITTGNINEKYGIAEFIHFNKALNYICWCPFKNIKRLA